VTNVIRQLTLSIALVVVLVVSASAQSAGTITGTVKDSSGAVLPGATVTTVNTIQAATYTAVTTAQGTFVLVEILPGTYTISVELSGFKKVEKSDVVLSTASKISVGEIVLDVGNVSETVSVVAESSQSLLKTESAERSDLVTNTQLKELALNGRNIADLFKTIPGIIAGGTQTTSTVQNVVGSFNINGTRSNQHEYTVDGVTNLNLGNNTGALVTINPDAVEEVKILTSNYQAEYGRAGGGFISLTTRGGTNEYRGGIRYFKRNEDFNANNYFNVLNNRPKPPYRYDYAGWDFGGPIPVGGSKGSRKVFFFGAQEYYQQKTPATSPTNIRVPTAAERNGDFSQTRDVNGNLIVIRDPNTGQPFLGNVIPSSRFAAGTQQLMNTFPLPNAPEGGNQYNYTSQLPRDTPRREDIVRVDWQITAETRLSGRYIHNKDEDVQPLGTTTAAFNFPLTDVVRKNGPGDVFSATLTHVFSQSLVNEFIFGAGRGGVFIGPVDLTEATRTKWGVTTPLLFPDADPSDTLPSVSFAGISGQTFANTNFNGTPFDQKFQINNFMNNLTKVWNTHSVKTGIYYQGANNRRTSFGPVQSNLAFGTSHPQNTGHPFANALLGLFDTYTQAEQKITSNYYYRDLSGYVQDTWKIKPTLTLDVGLRISNYQPIHDKEERLGFFNPELFTAAQAVRLYRPVCVGSPCTARALDPAISATPTLDNTRPSNYVGTIVAGSGNLTNGVGRVTDGYPAGGFETAAILWGPRAGFSWDVTGSSKTIVRGGFGISYDRIDTDRVADAITNPPGIQLVTLTNGSLSSLGATRSDLLPVYSDVVGTPRDGKVPTVYSYSVGVQREIGWSTVLDLAYVGTQSRHNPRQTDLNAIPYGAMFLPANQDPTRFGGTIPAIEPNLPQGYIDAGLKFSGANAVNLNLLRPYPGYGNMRWRLYDSRAGYDALQISANRRFSKHVQFGVSYTLSRAKTDSAGVTDNTHPFDLESYDYALANFDRTHYFVANYVWNLPEGGRLLGGGRAARLLLDGWTLSGISWVSSGNPTELAITIQNVNATQRLLGTDSGTPPNTSGDLQPRLRVTGDPLNSDGTINPAAFSVPGIGDIGPYDRLYVRNPGFNSHDLSVFKNVPFGGHRYLQLRVEMFNAFNIVQYSGRNQATNITNAAGQTGAAIFNNMSGLTVTNNTRPAGSTAVLGTYFGEYNAARDPRIIQLGVKLYF
jgi:Carboxypeptidase regulatory-like domain/TonB-dependent Receptor Plug Domain